MTLEEVHEEVSEAILSLEHCFKPGVKLTFLMRNPATNLDFLSQVQQLAPSVHDLISSKSARITAAIASHDVTGGYGRGFTFHLKLELLIEQCLTCFETPHSAPRFDCCWHRFEKRFMQIADAEAPTRRRWKKRCGSWTRRLRSEKGRRRSGNGSESDCLLRRVSRDDGRIWPVLVSLPEM